MPHGLHIDSEDNMWITDVALHQVSLSEFICLFNQLL